MEKIKLDILVEIIMAKTQVEGITENDISLETKLGDDLGLDSLDIVEIIMEVENLYDIYIPDNNYENVKTVKDLLISVNDNTKN